MLAQIERDEAESGYEVLAERVEQTEELLRRERAARRSADEEAVRTQQQVDAAIERGRSRRAAVREIAEKL